MPNTIKTTVLIIITAFLAVSVTANSSESLFDYVEANQSKANGTYINEFTGTKNWVYKEDLNKTKFEPVVEIVEVNQHPYSMPTEPEIERAWRLYNNTFENARAQGWFNREKGLSDGFTNVERSMTHYPNEEFLYDGKVLDPERPENLMYYENPETGKNQLLGVMFLMNNREATGPQIGGPLTQWHYHKFPQKECYHNNVYLVTNVPNCNNGTEAYSSPEMIHVWFVDREKGPFGTKMDASKWLKNPVKPRKLSRNEFEERVWKIYDDLYSKMYLKTFWDLRTN